MKFSVVIPVYNDAEGIDKCLENLNSQEGDRFEVIVVDDGSFDATVETLKKWKEKKDRNFDFVFVSQENKKQGAARNRGVEEASGEVIAFIGADIVVRKGWLKAHLKFHEDFPEEKAVGLGHMTWSPHLAKDRFRKWLESSGTMLSYKGLQNYKTTDFKHFYTGNISMKKSFFKKYLFDEDFDCYGWEDIMLGYRMLGDGGKLYYVENAKAYHDHPLTKEDLFPSRMREIGRSAVLFQKKFPEARVVPKGIKKIILSVFALRPVIFVLGFIKKEWGWYAESKRYFLQGVKVGKLPVKKVLIAGSYGAGNIGDEAMLDVILDNLPGNFEKNVLTGDVKDTLKRHPQARYVGLHLPFGIRSFLSFRWLKSFRLLRECDYFIFGGGGLFMDGFSRKAVLLWYWHVLWASFFNKKIFFFANSFGPFKSRWAKLLTKRALKKAEFVSVRDTISEEVVKNMGIKNVYTGADPVFLKNVVCVPVSSRGKVLALNLRPLKKYDYEDVVHFVEHVSSKGYKIYGISTGEADDEVLSKIGNIELYSPDSFDDLVNILCKCEVAIGMRLHFLIAAALADCRIGGLSYGSKVEGVLSELRLPFVSVEDGFLELSSLCDLFDKAVVTSDVSKVRKKAQSLFKLFLP